MPPKRFRMSIRDLAKDENKEERYAFFQAWKKIKELPSNNTDSFWFIASYYGQPFKQRQVVANSDKTWGGFSQHSNVLFPTWNRAYLFHLEEALVRAVPGMDDVTSLHYWDETSDETLSNGLPALLLKERVEIDDNGNTILNPLLNFKLPEEVSLESSDTNYAKPKGYITKRYPYAGLMDSTNIEVETDKTKAQNDYISKEFKTPDQYLKENIHFTLNDSESILTQSKSINEVYTNCLQTTNYNQFSNILSVENGTAGAVSLEEANNRMQLALGGMDLNGIKHGIIGGANGDIGTNHMAAFDPLFFLHLCNIDRIFWRWQILHNKTKQSSPFTINTSNPADKGITPKDGQGPTPRQQGDIVLDMNTFLYPFQHGTGPWFSSNDCIDIEEQLEYTYVEGSLKDTILVSNVPNVSNAP